MPAGVRVGMQTAGAREPTLSSGLAGLQAHAMVCHALLCWLTHVFPPRSKHIRPATQASALAVQAHKQNRTKETAPLSDSRDSRKPK